MPIFPQLPGTSYVAGFGTTTNNAVVVANDLFFVPFSVNAYKILVDRLSISVATGAASSAVRLGIYSDAGGFPGELINDAGTTSTTSSGTKTKSVLYILAGGLYWFAFVAQGGSPTVAYVDGELTSETSGIYYSGSTSGALPSTLNGTFSQVAVPWIEYRINATRYVPIGTAEGVNSAGSFDVVKGLATVIPLNTAVDVNAAQPITPLGPTTLSLGIATETDTANEIEVANAARDLATSSATADASSYTTSSYEPVGNRLVLALVTSYNGSTAPATPTVTGNGYTWVSVQSQLDSASRFRTTLFRAMVSSPTEGAATFDFGGETQLWCGWSIVEIRGTDTSGSNGSGAIVQSVKGTADATPSVSIALSSFAAATNYGFAAFGVRGYRTVSGGEHVIGSFGQTGAGTVLTEYGANDASLSLSITAGGTSTINAIAAEIKIA